MEDKDKIIRHQAARIRELEAESETLLKMLEHSKEEVRKLYARKLWQRVLNIIPD